MSVPIGTKENFPYVHGQTKGYYKGRVVHGGVAHVEKGLEAAFFPQADSGLGRAVRVLKMKKYDWSIYVK